MAKKQQEEQVRKSIEILKNLGNFENVKVVTEITRTIKFKDGEDYETQVNQLHSDVLDGAKKDIHKTLVSLGYIEEEEDTTVGSGTVKAPDIPTQPVDDNVFEDEELDSTPAAAPPKRKKKKTNNEMFDALFSDETFAETTVSDEDDVEEDGHDLASVAETVSEAIEATVQKKVK
jgi:hypothetical protein